MKVETLVTAALAACANAQNADSEFMEEHSVIMDDFQIKNTAGDKCLTMQKEKLYMSGNKFKPYAAFHNCRAQDDSQWFSHTELNQIRSLSGYCLKLAPVASWAHADDDSCSEWSNQAGIGTYLFVGACSEMVDPSEEFTYHFDGQFGSFKSGCAHQLEIASTSGNMAVVAGVSNSWNAEVVPPVKEVTTTQAPTTQAPTTEEPTTEEATTEEATTEEATTMAPTEAPTTISADCQLEFPSTMINSDHTIRILDSARRGMCAFKKYSSYNADDEIWYKNCDAGNTNTAKAGKYWWSFDESTGLIKSLGAEVAGKGDFCWKINSLTRYGKQRVKLAVCDDTSEKQQFQVINGRVHPMGENRLCLGYEEYRMTNEGTGVAMTFQDCYPSTWASGSCAGGLTNEDKSITVMGSESVTDGTCLFKKYSGYNNRDEIWIKPCDASNANAAKAGKYTFSYDAETGLISSEGSRVKDPDNVKCLRINNKNRFYKQRMRIFGCNADDELQQFDLVDGRLYSRANPRLCGGFEYYKLAADATNGTPFTFSTCFPNAVAVRDYNYNMYNA
jgi:hypothetical protein